MHGRRSVGGLIALWMPASGCSSPATPTDPSQSREITTGASGSGGTFTLQVSKNGTGIGTVTSSPSGISCGTACSRSFSGGAPSRSPQCRLRDPSSPADKHHDQLKGRVAPSGPDRSRSLSSLSPSRSTVDVVALSIAT